MYTFIPNYFIFLPCTNYINQTQLVPLAPPHTTYPHKGIIVGPKSLKKKKKKIGKRVILKSSAKEYPPQILINIRIS